MPNANGHRPYTLEPILLQVVGSKKKLGYGNDTDLRGFYNEGVRFERHDKVLINGEVCDIDMWSKDYAVKQITKGLNSCPLLMSCLFGINYKVLTKEGQKLIDQRESFISKKLITGTVRFCDRKIKQSRRPQQKYKPGKYVYYALSDMFEMLEILTTKDCVYPLRLSQYDTKLIQNLRLNLKVSEGYERYENLKTQLLSCNLRT